MGMAQMLPMPAEGAATAIAFTAVAALITIVIVVVRHRRSALLAGARPPPGVPTPRQTLPLLGNALEVVRNRHRLHDWLLDKTQELSAGGVDGGGKIGNGHGGNGSSTTSSIHPLTWAFTTPLNPLYLVISSPSALEHVLSAKGMERGYVKGPEFSARLGDLLGGGIFTADGNHWRWQRKLAAHLFSGVRFRDYVSSAFSQSIEHLFAALEPYAQAAGGNGNAPSSSSSSSSSTIPPPPTVDLHALMYMLTLDTFSRVGFGIELGMLEEAAAEARRRVVGPETPSSSTPAPCPSSTAACVINGVSGREFARAFDEAQRLANRRFWLPLWRLCELVTGDAARVKRDMRLVRSFAEGIVAHRRRLLDKEQGLATAAGGGGNADDDKDARPDLLTLFMRPGALASSAAARFGGGGGNGEQQQQQDNAGAELTDAEVVDAVLNFIIASRDTTAQATSWAFYELMRHPDVEAKLLAEAAEVLGGGSEGGEGGGGGTDNADPNHPQQSHPTYEQLRRLRYARAVFLEAVRLHPSIPQDAKYASVAGDVLPDGTPVPEGALMLYSPYVVCRLTSFWGEDAAEFRPERWLKGGPSGGGSSSGGGAAGEDGNGNSGGGAGGFLSPSPYQFPAFNAGPRLCLGRGFAELEGVYALVETLRRYRFVLAGGGGGAGQQQQQQEVTYEQSTSLPMLGGLQVRVLPRQLSS